MNTEINRAIDLFPFESRECKIADHKIHYVDEGKGKTILLIHGIPGWSFEFREIIAGLKKKFRVIAPDHLGFGLSEKSANADYSVQAHAARLAQFIDQLKLKDYHLVVHDFGGPISMGAILQTKNKPSRISLMNTWLFSLNKFFKFRFAGYIVSSFLGKYLYLKRNFSARIMLKSSFLDKTKLPENIHACYTGRFPDEASRVPVYILAKALLGEGAWFDDLAAQLSASAKVPIQLIWGQADAYLPGKLLLPEFARLLPHAKVHMIQAGHYPHEEQPAEVVRILREFYDS